MSDTLPLFSLAQYKLVQINDASPQNRKLAVRPEAFYEAWMADVPAMPWFDPMKECFIVYLLNTRSRITGWHFISTGTLDTVLVHARDVFRVAIVHGAAAITLAHNHPSGDPNPSSGDVKVTRELVRAGQLLNIEVLDHIIIGDNRDERKQPFCSMRERNYLYT